MDSESVGSGADPGPPSIEGISAITLATHDMARAVRFYQVLGFVLYQGGEESSFTSLQAGASYLNLLVQPAGVRGRGGAVSSSTLPTSMPSTSAPWPLGCGPRTPPATRHGASATST
jgi:hypothetical protein